MALGTPTGWGSGSGSTSSATASFTPAAGDVLFAWFGYRRGTVPPTKGTISDSASHVWVEVADVTYDPAVDPRMRFTVWKTVASGAAMVVTGACVDSGTSVIAVDGYAGASVNPGTTASGTNNAGDPSATIGAVNTGSGVAAAAFFNTAAAVASPSGYAEVIELVSANNAIEVVFDNSSPSTTVSWVTALQRGIAIAFEVRQSYALTAGAGSYAVTGTAATLRRALPIVAAAGSYAVTGTAATLLAARKVAADAGSYAVTGTAASVLAARKVVADAGSYAVTGVNADLLYVPVGGYTLAADSGSYAVTGSDATLVRALPIAAEAGSYAITGSAASLLSAYKIDAAAGSYALTGTAATLIRALPLAAAAGSYALSGSDATLLAAKRLAADAGSYALTGTDADLLYAGLACQADFTDLSGLFQDTGGTTAVTTAGQNVRRIIKGDLDATWISGTATWQATGLVIGGGARWDLSETWEVAGLVAACTPSTGDTSNNHGLIGGAAEYVTVNPAVYRWRDAVDTATQAMLSRAGMQVASFEWETPDIRTWMDGIEGGSDPKAKLVSISRLFHRATTVSYAGTVAYLAFSENRHSEAVRKQLQHDAAATYWTLAGDQILLSPEGVPLTITLDGTDDSAEPFLVSHHGLSGMGDGGVYNAANIAAAFGLQAFSPWFEGGSSLGNVRFSSDDYQKGGRADLEAPLLDEIRDHLVQPSKPALIFGHSAGGQWVSRVAAYEPAGNVQRYVVANPSTWVFPDDRAYPFGFGHLSAGAVRNAAIAAYLQLPLTVYIGELDNDPDDPDLDTSAEGMAQGAHRHERADNVWAAAQAAATLLSVTLAWKYVEAAGVGHAGTSMLNAPERQDAFFGEATIAADAGSYALAGTSASLLYGREAAAAAGSYAVTGSDAGLKRALPITAAAGSYAVSGTAATLLCGYRSAADAGSYAVTGSAATLTRALPFTAAAGSYIVTGSDATLTYVESADYTLAADAGSYSVTGSAASLLQGYLADAAAGSYAVAGSDAGLLLGRLLGAEAGSYAHTGSDAGLKRALPLIADAGAYAVTGTDASLLATRLVGADAGSYAHTGSDAILIASHAPLSAEAGSYTHTGADATLLAARLLAADAGSYAHTGQDVALTKTGSYLLAVDAGSYLLTGSDATLTATHAPLSADGGSYAHTGGDAALIRGLSVPAAAGAYEQSGTDATLLYARTFAADVGAYLLSGSDAAVLAGRMLSGEAGVYELTGASAALHAGLIALGEAGAYEHVGSGAGLIYSESAGYTIAVDAGSYLVIGSDAGFVFGRLPRPTRPFRTQDAPSRPEQDMPNRAARLSVGRRST